MRRVIPILFLLILASCREPMSVETFVPGDGPFEYAVNMTDSVAVYDFDFYSRIDARPEDCPGSLLLMIRWVSPTECVYRESVYLPVQPGEVYEHYRADVVPSEYGEWKLVVACPEAASVKGFRGLGLVTLKRHGAR